ncbi:MAG: RNA polymerase, sigma-24 subunit, ECF subfamily [Candidatus Yanofskybacteria bacterium GW2011_GWF1_44_227]|uniref:RNA polymerase, sigma-24 subunit, ECF subfamily n=1 Tax=Candidatus Yanofskybacteria bacterium GW2011_GWE2_40_11 TaxID=1619033 RepID=A0A0G0QLA7_9BACT|nr:MAG: RNA polymerase, sigma-24 subunit, ECF subfamily [Candidatus Yanofskybacteria bacterium GW2011_GWE1_40_10]KKR41204.1 MAG: RNA polymerase, sigma-24 subunit, ECF subfamily [Candidatus Yanofskybacteria bacterium GW2011_GWE2_40_11]KKT15718.1 MAG: RNA polymerase, sigma-24 subunit, ECF subfamily [Candidatus Yanofskybacteria bacterium GW2011_GWF2_43_596]KKT53394.1 MAG: RNA polymerase, sigma-24 subunit, ECF subfamily [Candidatus Yanofskybacteria bacterium GW2011_GWF1_44_227]OGN36193.1 MAG: hypot
MVDLKTLSDEKLIEYVRAADQDAYLEVVLRYQDKLLRYANYLAQDQMKSADIVQNAFIKAFVNLQSFNSKMKFSTWIYRIVHNEAMNEIVRYKKEMPMPEEFDFKSDENIEYDLIQKETSDLVRKCLSEMPLIYSEPLSLFFLEDKSYEEISDILRLPVGTVGTRINRAKILMKKICPTI